MDLPASVDPRFLSEKRRRFDRMRTEQWPYRQHWRSIRDFMSPRSGRYLEASTENTWAKGQPKGLKVINGVCYDAVRTLGAGLQGGLTSPSKAWFNLTIPNKDLSKYKPVNAWLQAVRDVILLVMARSNFYNSQHTCYEEIGLFGTTAMMIEEDHHTGIRCRPFTIGEFTLALDAQYRPATLYRQFTMTSDQIFQMFAKNKDVESLPDPVKTALKCNNHDQRWEIVHAVEPSDTFNPYAKMGKKSMKYDSVYWMYSLGDEGLLRIGGYASIPFIAPRWAVIGVDEYGNSPGMAALGDAKMLQKIEEKKLKALDKIVDPPMNAPASLAVQGGSVIPGAVNYLDVAPGQQNFAPAYVPNMNLNDVRQETEGVEQRIRDFFYNRLFLSLINETKRMSATEAAQRYEEKLVMLGPVLERVQSEDLDIVIERIFNILHKMGAIPPPPPELQGQQVTVEYVSVLAQAQKMATGAQSIEQFTGFVAQLAPLSPDALARADFGNIVKNYGDLLGIPADCMHTDQEVAKAAAQAKQQQALQQSAQVAEPMANAMKAAGQAQVAPGQSALQAMAQGAQGAGKAGGFPRGK